MRVSIVVPVHNQEANLERCVTSLINQTHRDIEIILVENGSSDRSLELCNEFARTDGRISVLHLNEGGVSKARNAGLSLASGPLLMFCDSDDWVEPVWVEHLHDRMSEGEYDLAVAGYTRVRVEPYATTGVERCMVPEGTGSWLAVKDFYLLERWRLLNPPWNKIYRRDVLARAEVEFDQSISIAEDMLFNLQYLRASSRIALVPESLYNYRASSEGTLSTSHVQGEWETATRVRSDFQALLKEVPGAWETYGGEFWSVYLDILERVIHREASASDSTSFKTMLGANNRVLRSQEARQIMKSADWGRRNPVYVRALKTRNYLWVSLYRKSATSIVSLKSILRGRQRWL